ncbi:MAG: trypsin-like serine protease [Betaproteobacteria bacterium]|nr:MAG: trypsin-like serine protease [Betaproteobacteria bacterium]
MKKSSLYSRSVRRRTPEAPRILPPQEAPGPQTQPAETVPASQPSRFARSRQFGARHERILLLASAILLSVGIVYASLQFQPPARQITQKDIDGAVLHTLDSNVLPSAAAKAYEIVQQSVVRVRRVQQEKEGDAIKGVGTGVVIVDRGIILTNLHVVDGAERVQVVFADGTESEASVIGLQPENDLAVLQAKTIPDDLMPATLRSTQDLAVGDQVIAVGFPFGIGPSASAGIISGLKRAYRSPEHKRALTNLIQFDAAANPGNSGGPLVTMDGEVVGIVTAILNPSEQSVFIGIGFAVPIENAASAIGISPF